MTPIAELRALMQTVQNREPGYGFAKIELDKAVEKMLPALLDRVEALEAALNFIVKQVENTPVNFDGSHMAWISSGAINGARAALKEQTP